MLVGIHQVQSIHMSISDLPTLNAILNSVSATFLAAGYVFIRQKKIGAHRSCMVSAFITSTLFLISYLVYHYHHGATTFQGQGIVRVVYLTVLATHTVLATAIVPMILVTFMRALRERFDRHRRIARWTLPLWFYVSVTGVVVYLMLYHLYS
jgi:putative membrane protein